jgi:hypothetical protein
MLPATPQINIWQGATPGYNTQLPSNTYFNNSSNPFANATGNNLNQFAGYQYQAPVPVGQGMTQGPRPGGPTVPVQPVSFGNAMRTLLGVDTVPEQPTNPNVSPTNVFKSPSTNAPANSLVGSQILNSPQQISSHQLRQIMPGLDPKQLQQVMGSRGYQRTYVSGVGEVWVQTGEAQTNAPIAAGMRPEYVDPTALERGERVTDAGGFSYVGGADYTNAEGETVSQYAVTIPGGPRAGQDKHGKYKWTSTVRQDKDGNWVRVYRQQLRKVYSRSAQKGRAARAEEAARNQSVARQVNTAEYNQLVNLRADYG